MKIVKNQLNRITEFVRPKEMIPTNRGPVPGCVWIQNECDRMRAKGKPAFVHTAEDGRLYLARKP